MKKTLISGVAAILLMALLAGLIPQGVVMAAPDTEDSEAALNEEEQVDEEKDGTGTKNTEETFAPEDMGEAGLLPVDMENAKEPDRTKPEYAKTSYVENVFFPETVMKGIFSGSELYFYIPEYWETQYVYVALEYRVSQLILEAESSLTFYINQVPITSCRITYESGDSQVAYVSIPVALLNEGYNSFRISAYARIFEGDGCNDSYSDANWLSISDASYIQCGYEMIDPEHRISYYPYPFLSTADATGQGLSIVVSDRATNEEVAAAMNLMTDLRSQTGTECAIQMMLLSDWSQSKNDRAILVCEYGNLPLAYHEMLGDTSGIEDQGIVVFTDDESGNPLMLITSKDGNCLLEAVYMLMDENRVSQVDGNSAKVAAGSADLIASQSSSDLAAAGNHTLGELNGGGLNFVGPFHQQQTIYLPFSENYYLSEAGKITLYFRYSENLDFNRSLLTVYWGDVPIASKKLEKEKVSGDELTFTMPADVVGTAAGSIGIVFDLEIPDMLCTPRQDQMPWAYVSDESLFYLPESSLFDLSFDSMPLPFRMNGRFNDVLLVISDQTTSSELDLCAKLVGMYGEEVEPYGTFRVKRAGEFMESDANYNIITTGTYGSNSFLRSINENLHFSYNSSGTGFKSNEQLILSDDYAANISILQLLESPYAADRGILALTGANESTLEYAKAFLSDKQLRSQLSRDCVIIDDELKTRAFRFIANSTAQQELSFTGTLTQNKQSVLFTVVATSVMLMLLIAVVIILIRIKMYHKTRDAK